MAAKKKTARKVPSSSKKKATTKRTATKRTKKNASASSPANVLPDGSAIEAPADVTTARVNTDGARSAER